jgi:undecaprenyl-diphosphatase
MMDKFMLFVTIKENFYGVGIACVIALLGVYKNRGLAFLVAAGVAIGLADAIGHNILKEGIERLRPCHVLPPDIIGMVSCSNSFSFPSNHAANSFAAATLLSFCFRNTTLLAFAFALIVCYSRVYLRVHYPSDVLGGAILGTCMGYLGYRVYGKILQYIKP